MSKILPGQDINSLRSNFGDSNESEVASKPIMWRPSRNEERNDNGIPRRMCSESWIQMGRHEPTYADMFSGFQTSSDLHGFASSYPEQNSGDKKSFLEQEGELSLLSGQWSLMPPKESNLNMATQAARYGGMGCNSSLQGLPAEENYQNRFAHLSSDSQMENVSQLQVVRPQPALAAANNTASAASSTWKIFGFNLNSNPPLSEPVTVHSNSTYELEACSQQTVTLHKSLDVQEAGQPFEPAKSTKSHESASMGSERGKSLQPSSQLLKDVPSKTLGSSTRSCTKVYSNAVSD